MSQALRRIQKELKVINENYFDFCCSVGPDDEKDLFHWIATIEGPEDSVYEGGNFSLNITFPIEYPFKPFRIRFTTKIYHPHVSDDGDIHCCDYPEFFSDYNSPGCWKPDMTIYNALHILYKSLGDIEIHCAGLNREATNNFLYDKPKFEAIAREWTKKYAM